MIKLPSGIEIKKLIDDLRILSWEASEILIYYEQILKDLNYKYECFLNRPRNKCLSEAIILKGR